jgi:hypothetical protein
MARQHSFVPFAALGLWASSAFLMAQEAPTATSAREQQVGPAVSLRQSCGLQVVDGDRLLGMGADYNAWFGPEGLSFTPALGERAPHDLSLAFTTTLIGRGADLSPVPAATRSHADRTVSYRRGNVVETYEVRSEGVKQSFVFHTLPQGDGDLVVRGAVTTALAPAAAAGDAMTWMWPGIGGVSITGVLGIDAAGRQVRGSLAACDGGVELRLPASFVAVAQLPLVLDPLVGTSSVISAGFNDNHPDLAWDASSGRWLAVWQRIFSGTNADIRGQFFDTAGAPIGGVFVIENNTATFASRPSVANINGANAFVVAYSYGGDVFARGVLAATGALTTEVAVATGSDSQVDVVLGGEALDSAGGQALAVWRNASLGSIHCRPIGHSGTALTLATASTVASGFSDEQPAVSRSGGEAGRLLITWTRNIVVGNLHGRVWQRGNTFATPSLLLVDDTLPCELPANDGDGNSWLLAYVRTEVGGADNDVLARSVRFDAGSLSVSGPEFIANDLSDDEWQPSVGWLGNSVLVTWMDQAGANTYDTYIRSIDPYSCTGCEGTYSLGITTSYEWQARVATKASAGSFGARDAAVVWTALDASSNGDSLFQLWRARHGAYTSLGGGCGTGGRAVASCATNPNTQFRLRLVDGPANTTVWGIFGFDRNDTVCTPCTLIPDPFTGIVWSQTTNAVGDVSLNLPIPAGAGGVQFYLQYVNLQPTCALGIETSTAILVGIEN